jgi:MoaA/NifB/PqqE/SkfB family radical SAM enzyme
MTVNGKNYTSNVSKLMKHLPKLEGMQRGVVSPVMIHMAPTNVCNLTCDYCCYGQRPIKGELSLDEVRSALSQFRKLGTLGMEWTGGGDPSMWKHLNPATEYAKDLGYDIGLISNALDWRNFNRFDLLQWMRVSFHAANVGKSVEPGIEKAKGVNPNLEVSGVYIWTTGSEKTIYEVARLADKYKIPTRVTPDLTLGTKSIDFMMTHVGDYVKDTNSPYLFLSDFNVKTSRRNDNCYMHMVKPFIYPDKNVYVCPSAALSPENNLQVNDKFKVCSIDDILTTYKKGVTTRKHDCNFCKYAPQNELVDDLLTPTKHNSFA